MKYILNKEYRLCGWKNMPYAVMNTEQNVTVAVREKLFELLFKCSGKRDIPPECGVQYNNKSMYKHDIKALILYAESLGIPFNVPEYIRKNGDIISDWEAGSRYDIGFSIRIDTLNKMLEILDEWYNQV